MHLTPSVRLGNGDNQSPSPTDFTETMHSQALKVIMDSNFALAGSTHWCGRDFIPIIHQLVSQSPTKGTTLNCPCMAMASV